MEQKKGKNTIGSHWFGFSMLSCSLLTVFRSILHIKVWAIYALPIAYIVFVALCIIFTALIIKNKHFKYLWYSVMLIIIVVIHAGEAFNCVKDIAGGTKTVKTDCFRIYGDSVIWFDDDEDVTLGLDKKMAKNAKGHFTYDKTETKTVMLYGDKTEVFTCTEIAEITYYPNTKMVSNITFIPKNG